MPRKEISCNKIFIAACNHYRHKEKRLAEKAGLNISHAYKEIKNINQK